VRDVSSASNAAVTVIPSQQRPQIQGQYCEDIELTDYLPNAAAPVSLVLDLCIAHERFEISSDPNLNGHLYYPDDIEVTQ